MPWYLETSVIEVQSAARDENELMCARGVKSTSDMKHICSFTKLMLRVQKSIIKEPNYSSPTRNNCW